MWQALGHLDVDGGELSENPHTCLALNRAYQEVLQENIKRIELVLSHNRHRQVCENIKRIELILKQKQISEALDNVKLVLSHSRHRRKCEAAFASYACPPARRRLK